MEYWYQLRMVYRLSESIIGHTNPSVKYRWEWSVLYLKAMKEVAGEGKKVEEAITKTLEQELWDEGIHLPLR